MHGCDTEPGHIDTHPIEMLREELIELQLLPQLQSEIAVTESTRALDPYFFHQHPCYVRIIGRFSFVIKKAKKLEKTLPLGTGRGSGSKR
jgi:hypothetical protein